MKIVTAASSIRTLKKPLAPLAERAALAARERTISLAQARDYAASDNFILGENRFQIYKYGKFKDPQLPALFISHLGSIFKGLALGFYFLLDNYQVTYVTVKGSDFNANFPPTLHTPLSDRRDLFRLAINIEHELMGLEDLSSRVLGKGGEALLALYNIAGESGIERICYLVSDQNPKAKQFYYNMGFGEPISSRWTAWEVKVPYMYFSSRSSIKSS